jgi:hypothetical protein
VDEVALSVELGGAEPLLALNCGSHASKAFVNIIKLF